MNCRYRCLILSIVLLGLAGCTPIQPAGYIASGYGGESIDASLVVIPMKETYPYQGTFLRDSDFIARLRYPSGTEVPVPNNRVNVKIVEDLAAPGNKNPVYFDGTYQFLSDGQKGIVVTYNGASVAYEVEVLPPGIGGPPGIIITGP
jgi:hypothetical protein